jgi:3-oxoacid CoA-transferase subunit A
MNGQIYVVADIHGSASVIKNIIAAIKNPSPEDIIIVAGDAGFEYCSHVMGSAKRAARKFVGTWIVMRGNHDSRYWKDHSAYNGQNYTPDEGWAFTKDGYYLYQEKYPNILYVSDSGGILNINDYNILFCPGAYSVDKMYRLRMNYPYNKEEQLTDDEMIDLINIVKEWNNIGFDIDYVIGHTFPKYLERYYRDLFMDNIPQDLVDKKTEQWLNTMSEYFELNPAFKQYYGGHFHDQRHVNDKYTMVYQYPVLLT